MPRGKSPQDRSSARERAPEVEAKVYVATQWQLMWWRFRKHRLALAASVVVILIYMVALLCEFIAPFSPETFNGKYLYAPPQKLRLVDRTEDGIRIHPYVYEYEVERDPESYRLTFETDYETKIPIGFFVKGAPYKLWGEFEADLHLVAPLEPDQLMFLLGSDRMGRDVFSRVVYGTRISMSIGLVGVFISLILGIVLGGISGYYGGVVDTVIQRVVEFARSIPTVPLWLGLAAALPLEWSSTQVYFAITVILSLIGWTGLARVVRGRFLSLREEDFVMAAKFDGSSEMRIILRHMVPSFLSHIIASVTMAIPGMILSETALSFLGLGIRPPAISWGVLLQEAQNVNSIATAPWLLLPGLAVIITVLALNFLGDGLRDAADPYA
jgi:peptide/nickel transport system permease protein